MHISQTQKLLPS